MGKMKFFNIIAAVDDNGGIGKDGKLPWGRLKDDINWFRKVTVGNGNNAVIMGRKTWDSLPKQFRPLPERYNIVLSRNLMPGKGYSVAGSLDIALHMAEKADRVFVTGDRDWETDEIVLEENPKFSVP